MPEPSADIFFAGFFFLFVPFLIAIVGKLIKFPPVIGYIIGGIILGTILPDIRSDAFVNQFAFFGILLLMFTIGLEVNFEKLIVLRKYIILGGILQIVGSFICIAILALFFSFTPLQALLIGIAFSASSTTLVAKIIQERGEESSFVGELAIGMLMFQDLAFIPFIIVFTFLRIGDGGSYIEMLTRMAAGAAEAAVILAIMYYVGKKSIVHVFNAIASVSRELMNVFIVLFIFLVAYLCTSFNIPVFIGMFIAGVLVSQTSEHYHIFSQIRPLRDILSIIFFVFIGTHVDLAIVLVNLPQLLLFTLLVMIVKIAVILVIFLYFRFNTRIAFNLALLLFQVSESAFILLTLSRSNDVFSDEQYLFAISVCLVSLICTPLIIHRREALYFGIRAFFRRYFPAIERGLNHRIDASRTSIDVLDIKDHVVICGYGRVGSYVGRALTLADIPYIAVDYNYHIVSKARKEGINAIYGDPTDLDILDFAQVNTAVALVSVVPDRFSQEAIVLNAKKLNPNIVIMSRIHRHDHQARLKDLGVDVIVQPEFEASLSIVRKLYYLKNVSRNDTVNKIRHFKIEQGIT